MDWSNPPSEAPQQLPKLVDTQWYKLRVDKGTPPDSWIMAPEIPKGWIGMPVAALKGLVTIIPKNAPSCVCLSPEYMRDKPVPDEWIHHQSDLFPCVLLVD